MSRLNDSIKCVVMLNNFTLAFLALIVVIVAALVFTGQWDDFDSETFETTCMWAFAIGGSLLVITIIGCMGAVNQIEREGKSGCSTSKEGGGMSCCIFAPLRSIDVH